MKNRSIGFGLFLLSIGTLWLLMNFGILDWSFYKALYKLWPLILIAVGVNVIFRENVAVKVGVWLLFLAALVAYGYFFVPKDGTVQIGEGGNLTIEKEAETKYGEIRLPLGGVQFQIDSTGAHLLDAMIPEPKMPHSVTYKNGNKENASIRFEMNKGIEWAGYTPGELFKVSLNDNVLWDMDINAGAVSGTMDMSELLVSKLDMKLGAGKVKMIFGDRHSLTDVDIKAGASSIEVLLPNAVGFRVRMDKSLNTSNLDSLELVKRGDWYETLNYGTAKSKVNLDVKMGLGELDIKFQP